MRGSYLTLMAALALVGCGTGDEKGAGDDGDDNPDGSCNVAPADAPTVDVLSAGGTSVICYYDPPEGYCREILSASTAAAVEGGDKAAIGCKDALTITNGTCPLDKLVGKCLNWSTEETRYYYECNQYDALFAGGPKEACESVGATWEPG